MKSTLAVLATLLFYSSLFSQQLQYQRFRFNISAGASNSSPIEYGHGGPLIIAAEPQYALNDKISFGARLEGTFSFSSSTLLTTDYHFNFKHFIRLFAGGGLGGFKYASQPQLIERWGGMARAGFDEAHFRLCIEYNVYGKYYDPFFGYSGPNEPHGGYWANRYWGITFGFYLGGGRKRHSKTTN